MRRIILLNASLLLCLLALTGCHEFADDTSTPTGPVSEVKAKEGETADLDGLKITITKSEFANSQLSIGLSVENKSDKPLTLKSGNFTATDSTQTDGLPTTCGGRGGFSGELAVGDKIESNICWFLVGGKPPITVTFEPSGHGKAIITLAAQ